MTGRYPCLILSSLSLSLPAQAADQAVDRTPAPTSQKCPQAAKPWNKARCAAYDDALRTNGYAAIYIGFLQRWERTSRAVGSTPWQSTQKDLKALSDAAQQPYEGDAPNLSAEISERALRIFNDEIQTNIEMVERLLRHKDLLQAFLKHKRAGLARLKVDLACFEPEGPLRRRFIEHRAQVQHEIAEFETFLAVLSPLDPKNQDSVFWLKNQWFDSLSWSGSVAKNAFWPYIGPYGSGRHIGSDLGRDRRTDMSPKTTQKLLQTLKVRPNWPFNRCEGGRYAGEDARVRTIYMRGPMRERNLYSYFNAPITQGFSLPAAAAG
jgi:hypothetical protein